MPLVHHDPVGQPAAADQAEHPVADVPCADGFPVAATTPATSRPGMSCGAPGGGG